MKATKAHKILVVDDNPDDTFMTKRALSKTAFDVEVETAERGEAAIELLRNEDSLPSLILLDLKMPGLSGIDTLKQIRSDNRLKGIPVIILTNSLLESDRKKSCAAGANDFLHKSFDSDRFGRDIRAVLERWLGEHPV